MAIWQTCYRIVAEYGSSSPSLDIAIEFGSALEATLPKQQSWSASMLQWGALDSTVVEVDTSPPVEISFRIDARESWESAASLIWAAAIRLRLVICTLDDRVLASEDDFLESMARSRACEFVHDPHEFLRRIGQQRRPNNDPQA